MSKIKSRYLILVILTLCILLITIGCSTEKSNPDFVDPTAHPELVDQSWLTGKPCALPCWQGLEPGKSTHEDVLNTLPNLSFLNNQKGITSDWSGEFIECKKPSQGNCMGMEFKNDRLSVLYLFLNYSITLDEVVKRLGEPDFIVISTNLNGRMDCAFDVFWLQQRMAIINSYTGKGFFSFRHDICDQLRESGGKLPKNIGVQMITIYAPPELEIITRYFSSSMKSWIGFSE